MGLVKSIQMTAIDEEAASSMTETPLSSPCVTESPKPLKPAGMPSNKVFVGGLSAKVSMKIFNEFFRKFGEISDSVIMLDKETQRSRGFGFVTYTDASSVEKLLCGGRFIEFNGRQVEVKRAIPRELMASADGDGDGGQADAYAPQRHVASKQLTFREGCEDGETYASAPFETTAYPPPWGMTTGQMGVDSGGYVLPTGVSVYPQPLREVYQTPAMAAPDCNEDVPMAAPNCNGDGSSGVIYLPPPDYYVQPSCGGHFLAPVQGQLVRVHAHGQTVYRVPHAQAALAAEGMYAPAYLHGHPAYSQPTYSQPAYGYPAYSQPAYSQPSYSHPTHAERHIPEVVAVEGVYQPVRPSLPYHHGQMAFGMPHALGVRIPEVVHATAAYSIPHP